jgi:hypothetical protein
VCHCARDRAIVRRIVCVHVAVIQFDSDPAVTLFEAPGFYDVRHTFTHSLVELRSLEYSVLVKLVSQIFSRSRFL